MMKDTTANPKQVRLRQLVDWHAAIISGLIGGGISLLTNILISWRVLGSPWLFVRIIASLALGKGVLPPPDDFSLSVLLAALGIHLVLSVIYALLIAAVVHQWGMIISFLGGALMGLAFYAINFYAFTFLFPWFYAFRGWIFLVMYILLGAFAGSVYELLEVERYSPIEEAK